MYRVVPIFTPYLISVPLWPTDSAKQNGRNASIERCGASGKRYAFGIQSRSADQALGQIEFMAKFLCYGVEPLNSLAGDFGANAVAGKNRDDGFHGVSLPGLL